MAEAGPIRVMLVDDTLVIRNSLELVLMIFDDLELVGMATGGEEAIALYDQVRPDVVLLDMIMPDMTGEEVTRLLLAAYPEARIIGLSTIGGEELLEAAIAAGARLGLSKNLLPDELAEAIRAVIGD